MAFADFLDLRTAVIEHVARPDIADVMPRLTQLAETDFNRCFRLRDQITTTTITPVDGLAPLPADYLEMIGVFDANRCEYIQQPLQPVRAENEYYSIDGANIVIPGVQSELTVQYYAQLPTISLNMTDTNWLLQKHPDVYLYGVGLEAAKYIRDLDLVAATRQLYDIAKQEVYTQDERERYSRARVRVTGVTP